MLSLCGSALLLFTLGCSHHLHTFTPQSVTIANCTASPKQIDVYENDTIQWTVQDNPQVVYSIQFAGRKPVPTSPFPATSAPQPIHRDTLCKLSLGFLCK